MRHRRRRRTSMWSSCLFVAALTLTAPRALPAAPAMSPAEQKEAQAAREAEEALTKLLTERRAVLALPEWVTGVRIDPAGQPWFEAADLRGSLDEVRESLKAAVEDRTRVIRGGTPILRDGRGRLWVVSSAGGNRLLGYDGKTWFDRIAADTRSDQRADWGFMMNYGWADAAGNCWFVGRDEKRGYGIHRLTPDDRWEYQNVAPKDEKTWNARDLFQSADPPLMTRQPDGRLTLSATSNLPDAPELRVLYFDGKSWAAINPALCTTERPNCVVPFGDGSIGTICGHGQLWTYWPESVPVDDKRVNALVDQLDAADPAKRDRATAALVAMGARVRPRLAAAVADEASPETRARLQSVLASFDAAKEDHGRAILHGGRYTFDACRLASRSPDGGMVLYVTDLVDHPADKSWDEALVNVSPAGDWRARPIPMEQWRRAGYRTVPGGLFEDARGRIYFDEGGLRINAATELERVTAFGVDYNRIDGADAAGRLYVSMAGRRFLLDETAAAPAGDLKVTAYRAPGWRGTRGDGSIVACFVDDAKSALMRFRGGAWASVPEATDKSVAAIFPLAGGAAVVEYAIEDAQLARFYDGHAWRAQGDNLWDLLQKDPEPFRKIAGGSFGPIHTRNGACRLAADPQGNLWFAHAGYEERPDGSSAYARRLYLNDGKTWRDVYKEAGLTPPGQIDNCLGAADAGRSVLLRGVADKPLGRVRLVEGAIRAEVIETPAGFHAYDDGVFRSSAGDIYFSMRDVPRLFRYAGDKVVELPQKGQPLLADAQHRLWFAHEGGEHRLMVIDADGTLLAQADIPALNRDARMLQARDGRILLFHAEALSHLTLDPAGQSLAIREAHRWKWDTPKNKFENLLSDAEGGVWLDGGAPMVLRVSLPPADAK